MASHSSMGFGFYFEKSFSPNHRPMWNWRRSRAYQMMNALWIQLGDGFCVFSTPRSTYELCFVACTGPRHAPEHEMNPCMCVMTLEREMEFFVRHFPIPGEGKAMKLFYDIIQGLCMGHNVVFSCIAMVCECVYGLWICGTKVMLKNRFFHLFVRVMCVHSTVRFYFSLFIL